jgi:hypothetical protein
MKNKIILFQTKSTKILILFFFAFLFTSCCDIGYLLSNNENSGQDLYYFVRDENNTYTVRCEERSGIFGNHYTYEENPDKGRFQYRISISYNKQSAVKLNAFKLTNLDDTPIVAKYYVETFTKAETNTLPFGVSQQERDEAYKKDSLLTKIDKKNWEFEPDSLPIVLRDSGERKAHVVNIYVETNEPYSEMKNLKVYYDFEVGENRFVSENIEYKWRRYCDCRPKLW